MHYKHKKLIYEKLQFCPSLLIYCTMMSQAGLIM